MRDEVVRQTERANVSSFGFGGSPEKMTSNSKDQYSKHTMMADGIASAKRPHISSKAAREKLVDVLWQWGDNFT
jgi:hypothetical protein